MILALLALGETAGAPEDHEQTATCAQCRSELSRLTVIVEMTRQAGITERLEQPPPRVWQQITAAVGNGAASPAKVQQRTTAAGNAGDLGPGENSARETGTRHRRGAWAIWRRSRLASGIAGLAEGLIIGVGGAAGIGQLTTPASGPAVSLPKSS